MITEMKGCNNTQNDTCINAISLSHFILFCFPCLSQNRFVLQYMSLVFSFGLSSLLNKAATPKYSKRMKTHCGVKSQHIKDLKLSD